MSSSRTIPLLRLCRIACVAVVFGVWFGGEQACQASCGDYLAHPGEHADSRLASGTSDKSHPVPASPCRGANCSRRSETPPLPTRPTVETTVSVEWACLLQQIRDSQVITSGWLLESDKVLARHLSHRLKRPPRG